MNKILDFLPLKVIHGVKYSCLKSQFIGKVERSRILVFTKVCLAESFLLAICESSFMQNLKILQIFGLTKLSTVLQYKFQNW